MSDDSTHLHLADLPVRAFLDTLAAATPTPGGGSAAALSGATAAALVQHGRGHQPEEGDKPGGNRPACRDRSTRDRFASRP